MDENIEEHLKVVSVERILKILVMYLGAGAFLGGGLALILNAFHIQLNPYGHVVLDGIVLIPYIIANYKYVDIAIRVRKLRNEYGVTDFT